MAQEMQFEVLAEVETPPEVFDRIRRAKQLLGDRLVILGHHYQRDEVIQYADKTGDSYGLSKYAANTKADFIVFCGVYFMAETADILSPPSMQVILPDLQAGCSLADMATLEQVESAWDEIGEVTKEKIIPITYVNSSADIKAFCGKHDGVVCTSSNARPILEWAFQQNAKVFFFPDQHLGRNTAYAMGIPLDQMTSWNPCLHLGGGESKSIHNARVILWEGYCSVHQHFLPAHIKFWRQQEPEIKIIVHPECSFEVAQQSDYMGSTAYIIKTIEAASPGTKWAVGTEFHLVNRLKIRHPDKMIVILSPFVCQCSTMYRIDPIHLMNSLENLVTGNIENVIKVPEETARYARISLQRMMELSR